jgi:hypothetical protein
MAEIICHSCMMLVCKECLLRFHRNHGAAGKHIH